MVILNALDLYISIYLLLSFFFNRGNYGSAWRDHFGCSSMRFPLGVLCFFGQIRGLCKNSSNNLASDWNPVESTQLVDNDNTIA
jgi:hypothetical protein